MLSYLDLKKWLWNAQVDCFKLIIVIIHQYNEGFWGFGERSFVLSPAHFLVSIVEKWPAASESLCRPFRPSCWNRNRACPAYGTMHVYMRPLRLQRA